MGSPKECPDASKEAYENTGILTPASDASVNLKTSLGTGARKRKRDGNTMTDLLEDPFVVKPHPSTLFTKPRILRPIALLPRLQLPLSCLDLASSGALPSSRLFESHVKILELEQRIGNTPVVLVACLDDGKSLFAVERESRGLYVLCKLGSWIGLNQLCAAAIVSRHQSLNRKSKSSSNNTYECQVTLEASKYNRKKRLAIEAIQSMVKRPPGEILFPSETLPICEPQPVAILDPSHQMEELLVIQPLPGVIPDIAHQGSSHNYVEQGDIAEQPMADQILDNIRLQYFEALYLSKASLAYFAKGPLSRARAAFHLDYDSTLDMNDLVQFLDSLILSTNLLDKKYKDGVPSILSSIIIVDGSLDEAEDVTANPKRRKGKKMKPDKKGLYPAEGTFVRRWWGTFDDTEAAPPVGSGEETSKKRTAQLRIRETQLQMIVILETLALLPLARSQTDHSGELPLTCSKDIIADEKATARSKSKKSRDLMALLDIHVDRLCIWQSVAAEDGTTPGPVTRSRDPLESGGVMKVHAATSDVLREFCIEAIMPFFSARLPEQCAAISRKLGGPIISSPVRPKLVMATSSSAISSRPGAVVKLQALSKPRRSLQRLLTDDRCARSSSRGPSGAISLMRSATAPAVPGLKREGSESSLLGSIQPIETQAIHASRGGVLKSKKFSQREVDLSNLAIANEPKLKKANIEAELKDAIAALKRPNRKLAVQELVETAERRASFITNHSRKSKKPVRNPLFQGVQILATPKGHRKRDVTVARHANHQLPLGRDLEPEVIPPSSLPMIPQSVSRDKNWIKSKNVNRCSAAPNLSISEGNVSLAIQVTPSRGQLISDVNVSTRLENYNPPSHSELPPSSPLRARYSRQQPLLDIPVTPVIESFRTPKRALTIQATPTRFFKEHNTGCDDSKTKPIGAIKTMEPIQKQEVNENNNALLGRIGDDTIYQKLGWDDDDFI